VPVKSYGDQANLKYMVAASFIDYTAFSYISQKTGIEIPFNVEYEYAGRGKSLSEFDLMSGVIGAFNHNDAFHCRCLYCEGGRKDTITRLACRNLNLLNL